MNAAASRSSSAGFVYGAFAAIAFVLGLAIYFSAARSSAVQRAYDRQAEFKQLATELAAASDLLTGEVRRYTQFGERAHYDNYWREVKETRTRDRVVARLGELGAARAELDLLETAKRNSDALIAIEDSAMKLVERAQLDSARRLVFGPEYDAAKRIIMEPIAAFETRLGARTAAEVEEARAGARAATITLAAVTALVILGITIAFRIFRVRFARPITRLGEAASALARGRIDVDIDIEARDELGVLVHAFREMTAASRAQAEVVQAIAAGDLTVQATVRSGEDVLGRSTQHLAATLRALVEQTNGLAAAAKSGRLDQRGDAAQFQGAYRELVDGINETLGAVVEPISEASAVLGRVAARNLTARMTGSYRGDFAAIRGALNTAVQNLEDALSEVSGAAAQVASAGDQITAGSQALAQGANEQASSLEEVSSSLQELASMARQSAGNATGARALAEGARAGVSRGVSEMTRLTDAMGMIKASSDETAKIVKTIDEIAFQTNLLALNAAVEAARAGDAGRGFAVVAEEVRALALRAAEAAKQTAGLIEGAVRNADAGVALNAEVLGHLTEIDEQVGKVTTAMAEIAAASEQQSQGVAQINAAVEQMNTVTQQVAAHAEESASSAEELNGQARQMAATVGSFVISGRTEGEGAPGAQRRGASGAHTRSGAERSAAPLRARGAAQLSLVGGGVVG
jgi:methyl-accepting chemotaxis protein